MRLVVGLGNPGVRYARTRHNAGALVVARASERWHLPLSETGGARWGQGHIGPVDVVLATPLAWMNQSGPAVKALLERLNSSVQDLVVVHDDLDLPLGRLRIKRDGGTGGHNGILSIVTALESHQFCRLKVGIGTVLPGRDPAEYVLSPFDADEVTRVDKVLEWSVSALESILVEGIDAAMNRHNVRPAVDETDEIGEAGKTGQTDKTG